MAKKPFDMLVTDETPAELYNASDALANNPEYRGLEIRDCVCDRPGCDAKYLVLVRPIILDDGSAAMEIPESRLNQIAQSILRHSQRGTM
jgi:hypothetical protein